MVFYLSEDQDGQGNGWRHLDGDTCFQMGFLRAVREAIRMLHRAIISYAQGRPPPKRACDPPQVWASRPSPKAREGRLALGRSKQPPPILPGDCGGGPQCD
ncbi:hypothetical protein ACJRO7_016303 [Eucalyptus globulus]|uniref:Uncharacterized protein n=1 Tax=Eucalyptus globulus TaxID=34317 RepID=A0ABD3L7Q8_EUCGL